MKTLVYQSVCPDQIPDWIQTCLESVRGWCKQENYDYALIGDEIFSIIPDWYWEKTCHQKVIATDLGRLLLARKFLEEGYDRVIWLDADVFIFAPELFKITITQEYAFGREVWIQHHKNKQLKAYPKIHNAVCVFCQGNSFLDFYIHACQRIIQNFQGTQMVPQLVGPKFLSLLHNTINLPVIPEVAMFSPLVLRDILNGGGEALKLHQETQNSPIYAANLSGSLVEKEEGLSEDNYQKVTQLLLDNKTF
ncbi:MAG: hypothetical protein RI580_05210 [Halothece sp. Uz-M2-17]|nr:hypothetical protein [Halothece sp. Uz-M2-17]